jgi:mRNA interferase MazF
MKRGEIYRFALDPTVGSELQKTRPCVIVQRDLQTERSPVTIVCPLTDASGRPGNILNPLIPAGTGGTTKDSLVCCHQVRTLDCRRVVGEKLGELSAETMAAVSRGLRAILDLDAP